MAKQMSEAQMVGLVRNALLVAGYEMGQTGDHWPVINSTIHSIARDWEESKIDEHVDAEMKTHLYAQIQKMEKELQTCTAAARAELAPMIKELRESCDAYFEPCEASFGSSTDHAPPHIQRAEAIIATLGGENE